VPRPKLRAAARAGAEDDDAWMSAGAEELARELAAREAELAGAPGGPPRGAPERGGAPGFDPAQMAERVKASARATRCGYPTLSCGCEFMLPACLLPSCLASPPVPGALMAAGQRHADGAVAGARPQVPWRLPRMLRKQGPSAHSCVGRLPAVPLTHLQALRRGESTAVSCTQCACAIRRLGARQAFLGGASGPEGAEVPRGARAGAAPPAAGGDKQGISLDAGGFWAELGAALGLPAGAGAAAELGARWPAGDSDEDEGSSFFTGSGSDSCGDGGDGEGERGPHAASGPSAPSGAEDAEGYALLAAMRGQRGGPDREPGAEEPREQAPRPAPVAPRAANTRGPKCGSPRPERRRNERGEERGAAGGGLGGGPGGGADDERWEAATATDSDDERGGATADEFDAAYAAAMAEQLGGTAAGGAFALGAAPGAGAGVDAAGRGEGLGLGHGGQADLQPVDVDVNLVQSLLASYAGQQGLPGPASTLAGLLGIRLPDDADALARGR